MLKRRGERRSVARQENETLQIVSFRVGAELYGLDIAGVQEIDRVQPITKVPQALSFVEGVIHVRGAIIPVVDLARRFGLAPIVADRQTRIIIASLHGQSVGFIVSAVTEVISVPVKSIGQAPPLTFDRTRKFITGMVRIGEALISILSIDHLLSTEEIGQLQQQQTLF
ncbi:MAG: chemotaxis protein CheW [Candidatus Methylomirabilia bacterium]